MHDPSDSSMSTGTEPFFRKLDWSAFWTACAASFVVYLYTLAPTVTLEDGGELAVAADSLGVPHPPGYPIWTMISWLFTRIFSFVTFRGQPNPSWGVGFTSVVFGALAAGISAMLICRSGSRMLRESRDRLHNTSHDTEDLICWVGGVASSLLFAFSPVMWSQSVIVEVYSLNAFFLLLVFLLTYQWMERPGNKLLYLMGFVFGLGLTNYQVLLLAALPLAFAILLRDIKLFRDFAIVGLPYLIVLGLIKRWSAWDMQIQGPLPPMENVGHMVNAIFNEGMLPPIMHPTHFTCWVYMIGNVAILALAYFFLPRGRTVALTLLFVELGLSFYAYMPIVSDLRNPPMNWGYPRTWEGFLHAISRGQYERIKPADMLSPQFLDQLGAYLIELRGQFTLPVALLGFLPFTVWQIRIGQRRIKAMYAAIALAVMATGIIVIQKLLTAAGAADAAAVRLDKFFIGGILLIMLAGGASIFISQVEEFLEKLLGRIKVSLSERITVGLALAGIAGGYIGYVVLLGIRVVKDTAPLRAVVQPGVEVDTWGILLQAMGMIVMMAAPAALVVLLMWMRRGKLEFRMTIDRNTEKWIIATLLGFLAMSIMLIALANPKGDIQDTFIQRVKFISSHALYALWIGYGLIFGLAVLDTLCKENRWVKWVSLGTAALLPLVPLNENAHNRELIRTSGGAEQNGHDFGWQFGNYQLRGAEAILEELDEDEEPLPNPLYPPEMGKNAIFFGGTDPGRFVPTYMIYGARVREDVYLITQNALADNTYMSVMRDLYGDQIWIPAQPDSAAAFERYVREVQSGKRPRNAHLNIHNGRVQVSGALGVMEINGILTQMIFEHNNYRHDFYVEESYVIRWMFPYMEPHGLILKINPEKTELTPRMVQNDMDFWDWYTRRLISDQKFRRDVVARKSFSKLRSAIAGLYSQEGSRRDAEIAYHQARTLYPLSPEATFRLTQEVLMPEQRREDARAIMQDFLTRDPNNKKVPSFLKNIDEIDQMTSRIRELQKLMTARKLDITGALELAGLYLSGGMRPQFRQLCNSLARDPKLPPGYKFHVAQLYQKAGMTPEMVKTLDDAAPKLGQETPANILLAIARMYATAGKHAKTEAAIKRYLAKAPGDWRARIDLAAMQHAQGKNQAASATLATALRQGGAEAHAALQNEPTLQPLRRLQAPTPVTIAPGLLPSRPSS